MEQASFILLMQNKLETCHLFPPAKSPSEDWAELDSYLSLVRKLILVISSLRVL